VTSLEIVIWIIIRETLTVGLNCKSYRTNPLFSLKANASIYRPKSKKKKKKKKMKTTVKIITKVLPPATFALLIRAHSSPAELLELLSSGRRCNSDTRMCGVIFRSRYSSDWSHGMSRGTGPKSTPSFLPTATCISALNTCTCGLFTLLCTMDDYALKIIFAWFEFLCFPSLREGVCKPEPCDNRKSASHCDSSSFHLPLFKAFEVTKFLIFIFLLVLNF
jgi:hypothetical protein